jgi:hypothetical protein
MLCPILIWFVAVVGRGSALRTGGAMAALPRGTTALKVLLIFVVVFFGA